jgi:hypothetical protein
LAIWPGLWKYERLVRRGDTNSFFGPLAQTEFGEVAGFSALHTLNLLLTRAVGNNSAEATQFNPAWQSRLLIHPLIERSIFWSWG